MFEAILGAEIEWITATVVVVEAPERKSLTD
jgi:hypothetical protein